MGWDTSVCAAGRGVWVGKCVEARGWIRWAWLGPKVSAHPRCISVVHVSGSIEKSRCMTHILAGRVPGIECVLQDKGVQQRGTHSGGVGSTEMGLGRVGRG